MTEVAAFCFDADDRHFDCLVERGRSQDAEPWWWFSVSGEQHRHPVCRSRVEDTREDIQSRVLSHFRALLVRRAFPLDVRSSLKQRLVRQPRADNDGASGDVQE